jgi:glycosidase
MPRVVMMAKNAYVWLDQLSKRYQRDLRRLDQVPDEEIDRLARWGFTGLWLIGLWERSSASKRIKQMCGNPEAEASAYSLSGYDISLDLGGWEAFNDLKDRAWQRGIRMAGDMVPNHMGIDAHWVIEHPDWFISLSYSPFPSYTFNGPDLTTDSRVGIILEDHYYSRDDAAVVFKRVDHGSGDERYIYHGNDGTSMPWNDTAQLDFLNPQVREAVIQTILHVARSFPIIRFDAAMTLTKKHFQRLWFPEPGSGGDIPSRADHGMSRQSFDEAMPKEFWREVVDRIAREVPDTLLLAEAFWMLEGYFVRTLGMHRVYNSAFMNMLKNEENAKYRRVIKNTLEFNPEILKRFVNFMNNPDEETTVAQFGKGDKYFGVCLLMATLPGLPMFGHGQVEGLTEKYGMEYRKANWEELPDEELVRRHEREIFPLLHRRYLFSDVRHFQLYDFRNAVDSDVNEDVFAYSNRTDRERVLVVYHNRYAEARGWVHMSSSVAVPNTQGTDRTLTQRTLGEALGLANTANAYCIFRDHLNGREYLRSGNLLHQRGLYVELQAYRAHVFLDFREVTDSPGQPYAALSDYLDGRAVPSVEAALQEILLKPVHLPFSELVNAATFRKVMALGQVDSKRPASDALVHELSGAIESLCRSVKDFSGAAGNQTALALELKGKLTACLDLCAIDALLPVTKRDRSITEDVRGLLEASSGKGSTTKWDLGAPEFAWGTLLGWLFVHPLGGISGRQQRSLLSRSWIDEWLLGKLLASVLGELGLSSEESWQSLALIKILTSHQFWFDPQAGEEPEGKQSTQKHTGSSEPVRVLQTLIGDTEVQEYLRINRHRDVLWFQPESLDRLLAGLLLVSVVDALTAPVDEPESRLQMIRIRKNILDKIRRAKEISEYQVEKLLAAAKNAGDDVV